MKQSTLTISDLHVNILSKEILKGVTLTVKSGEVHAIMGPNGSGKSTLAYAAMGHPSYENSAPKGKLAIDAVDLMPLSPEERAKAGVFLAFQSPIAVPGVTVVNLLRTAYQELHKNPKPVGVTSINPVLARRWNAEGGLTLQEFTTQMKKYSEILKMDQHFFERGIHDGFSGGERKKLEMLQALVLKPKFAFFDEIDTGLDVDALKTVAQGIVLLKEMGIGVIIITHYQRILEYITPDIVHVLVNGKIVRSGGSKLAEEVEKEGYTKYVTSNSTH